MADHTILARTASFIKRVKTDRRIAQRRKAKATAKGRAEEVADTEKTLEDSPVSITISIDEQLFGKR